MSISGRRKPAPDQRLKARPHSILVSVSGLIGRSVYDRRGNRVGRVHDLVVALGNGGDYPPLHGILVRTRRKVVFIPYAAMAGILRWEVYLTTSGLQPHPVPNQDGFVALSARSRSRSSAGQRSTSSKRQCTENTIVPLARG
jgi:hypothetical protein